MFYSSYDDSPNQCAYEKLGEYQRYQQAANINEEHYKMRSACAKPDKIRHSEADGRVDEHGQQILLYVQLNGSVIIDVSRQTLLEPLYKIGLRYITGSRNAILCAMC